MPTAKHPFVRKYLPGLLLLAVSLGLTWGVVNHFRLPGQSNLLESMAMDMNSMKPEPGAVPVGTAKVEIRQVQPELEYSGTIKGLNEISIAARIDGTLSAVTVYTGAKVARGQLLAEITAPELGAQTLTAVAEKAEAQQELAVTAQETVRLKAEVQAATAVIAQEQAGLKSAEANQSYWQARLPREKELYDAGGIALEEFQRYQADARVADNEVIAARQRVTSASQAYKVRAAMINENNARQRQQQAGIQRAGANLREKQVLQAFARITAPIGGIITERLLAPGSVVTAGTPFLTLAQIDPVRVQIKVPEANLAGLKVGGSLILSTATHPHDEIEASISSLAPTSSSGSRTHAVEAIVPNPEGNLLPGQYVKARLRGDPANSPGPALPERAVFQLQGQDQVWINNKGRAHLAKVEVLTRNGDWLGIKGLAKGTEVITDGFENLTEGMAVTPVRWTENGPEQLPQAGGEHRLTQANGWTLQSTLDNQLSLKVSVKAKPPVAGSNSFLFELSQNGKAVKDASIKLQASMLTMDMGITTQTARSKGDGRYEASLSGMSGLWQVVTEVEAGGHRNKAYTFEFSIP